MKALTVGEFVPGEQFPFTGAKAAPLISLLLRQGRTETRLDGDFTVYRQPISLYERDYYCRTGPLVDRLWSERALAALKRFAESLELGLLKRLTQPAMTPLPAPGEGVWIKGLVGFPQYDLTVNPGKVCLVWLDRPPVFVQYAADWDEWPTLLRGEWRCHVHFQVEPGAATVGPVRPAPCAGPTVIKETQHALQ